VKVIFHVRPHKEAEFVVHVYAEGEYFAEALA
jgi:hypothetical protein